MLFVLHGSIYPLVIAGHAWKSFFFSSNSNGVLGLKLIDKHNHVGQWNLQFSGHILYVFYLAQIFPSCFHFASKDIWSSSTIILFYSSLSHFYTFTGTFSRASEEEFNVPPRNMMSPGFYNQSSLPFYHPLCFLYLWRF